MLTDDTAFETDTAPPNTHIDMDHVAHPDHAVDMEHKQSTQSVVEDVRRVRVRGD